jgi:hypothetical protein
MIKAPSALALATFVTLSLGACSKEEKKPQGSPPPPEPSAAASAATTSACASGGGTISDAISAGFFPRAEGGFCVDSADHVRTYGEKAKLSMDEVCTTAFDGECEVYKRYGLKRTVFVRYVDGKPGAVGTVEVYLSEFKEPAGSYGMYTKRVVADADPARTGAPKTIPAGGAGAMGTGRAYVWKGGYLVELQYNNDQESEEQLRATSDRILPALAKAIGDKLPGDATLPLSARLLPADKRVEGGITFLEHEPLNLPNIGAGAIGYYKEGEKRFRVVVLARDEAPRAQDDLKVVKGRPGALPLAGVGDEGAHVMLAEGDGLPKSEYLFGRKGNIVIGVGDEPFAIEPGMPESKQVAVRLTKDEKLAHLKTYIAGLEATGALAPAKPKGK